MTDNAQLTLRRQRPSRKLALATLILPLCALALTGCGSSDNTADQSAHPTGGIRRSTTATPSAAPSSNGKDKDGVSQVVTSKDGVSVKAPVRKPSGDAMWLSVQVTNDEIDSASYKVEIQVTGAGGFNAKVRAETGVLVPHSTASQALTAMDASGKPAPGNAEVKILSVTRSPS